MIDQIWANSVITCCLEAGIDRFFVAPGSRCTPLTLAVAKQAKANVVQHFDERGLAFAALGFGKATGKPGVFICTSGTAVANAFPAVIEASVEGVPLLLFTADRPAELHGTGANQTIMQKEIFGSYPELFLNMPVPEDACSREESSGEKFLSEALGRSFVSAKNGPVHVNWMFREPFTISEEATAQHLLGEPFSWSNMPDDSDEVNLPIKVEGNVLIALGSCKPHEAVEARKLADHLGSPMLSDICSGLRTGSFELPTEFSLPRPDTVLHVGGRILSKSWLKWLNSLDDSPTRFIHVTSSGKTFNPVGLKQERHTTSLTGLVEKVHGQPTSDTFARAWREAAVTRDEVVVGSLFDPESFSEPAIAYFVSQNCPVDCGLFVGNSMPIRDLDWFGIKNSEHPRLIEANRGASGIDGLLATAVGYATGLQKPTTVVLGDLSALHDLNSFSLLANSTIPLIVLVLNNQGGHIFDLLPIHQSPHFEKFFATPHEYQFEHAARMFGLRYQQITNMDGLKHSYGEALQQNKSTVLELVTDRQTNLEVRQFVRDWIKQCNDNR